LPWVNSNVLCPVVRWMCLMMLWQILPLSFNAFEIVVQCVL